MHKKYIIKYCAINNKIRTFFLNIAGTAVIIATCQVSNARADDRQLTNIMRQDLGAALIQIAQQRNISIIYNPNFLKGKKSSQIKGYFTTQEVLQQLLKGSGFIVEVGNKGNFYIRKQSIKEILHLKANVNNKADKISNYVNSDEESETPKELEDIVTTGSRIPGVGVVGSQVLIFDREEIDQKGFSTLPQLIQSLPQNFNGGISESTSQLSLANASINNQNEGTGINLRGLGNVSTLVLLDGQRLAPSGLNGSYVDISMIPLSAIERVEVLTDGASAIYGSDAIGGVVNFKLRKDYDGAETRLRYGLATEGGLEEVLIGQTFGKVWEQGQGLISYEYSRRASLDAKDRNFTKNAPAPNDLLPEQEKHSVFLAGEYSLTEDLDLFTTAYYNERNSKRNQFLSFPPSFNSSKTRQYGGTISSALDLGSSFSNGWRAEIEGAYSRNEYILKTRDQDDVESDSRIFNRFSESMSVNINFDGTLFSMTSGDAKLAIGGHFRHENFGDMNLSLDPSLIQLSIKDSSRAVMALYGEIYLPIVGEGNQIQGVDRLQISASGRFEHYSDFGSTTNPKIGVLWSPTKGINIRGTYSTSFRAPLLDELDETANVAILFNNIPNDMSATGTSLVIQLAGPGNTNLQPEAATLWTLGADYQPVALPNFKMSATYFNINYKNRIDFLRPSTFTMLTNSNFTKFADFNGPDAELFALIENYQQLNFTFFPAFGPPANFTDADVIFDARRTNLSRNKVTGLDLEISYDLETNNFGRWNFSLGGTYLFDFLKQVFQAEHAIDVVGTINNPVTAQFNGGIVWAYKGFTTNLVLNYVDDYKDDRTTPGVPVKSWTTANLIISYNTEDRFDGWLNETLFTLNVNNLFNQDPPFINALRANTNINYDPNAASPAGRLLSFQITKQW